MPGNSKSCQILRGDRVIYKDVVYYYQPNGKSCFLYEKYDDIGKISKKIYSPLKSSVIKFNTNECDKIANHVKNKNSQMPSTKKNGYVYVAKDIEDHKNFYKIGFTENLKNRIKVYKTGQPTCEYVLIIKTTNFIELESKLKNEYVNLQYQNEIFCGVKLDSIRKKLKSWGYKINDDGIYINKKVDV
ncbi:putative ORFan [Tupanvirus deep ocean]|uniref:ORFan n=2 Tax=Tupanvirus TaxID=2094720 RepID=A0AC62AAC1_9VIRU|nr:putative ORFan [Tupanvirus deep ocean]QKU34632.1 putative ORFan [Tupanvirus deep ocean]